MIPVHSDNKALESNELVNMTSELGSRKTCEGTINMECWYYKKEKWCTW